MERYWDLPEEKRGRLTEDEVRRYLDVELMEHGAVRPAPLKLQELAPVTLEKIVVAVVKTQTKYHQEENFCGFPTAEQAEKFLALNPFSLEHDYESDTRYVRELGSDARIAMEQHTHHQAVLDALVALRGNKAKREANEKSERAFREAAQKVDDATKDLWTDWHRCLADARRRDEIASTREEYIKLTQGNVELAETFLAKAFPAGEIKKAVAEAEISF